MLFSCSDCNDFERKLQGVCVDNDTQYSVGLNTLTDFQWDQLYVVVGPRFPSEVQEIIGVSYTNLIKDGHYNYIFLNEGKIVEEYSSSCNNMSYSHDLTKLQGYVEYNPDDNIKITKKGEGQGDTFYLIEK